MSWNTHAPHSRKSYRLRGQVVVIQNSLWWAQRQHSHSKKPWIVHFAGSNCNPHSSMRCPYRHLTARVRALINVFLVTCCGTADTKRITCKNGGVESSPVRCCTFCNTGRLSSWSSSISLNVTMSCCAAIKESRIFKYASIRAINLPLYLFELEGQSLRLHRYQATSLRFFSINTENAFQNSTFVLVQGWYTSMSSRNASSLASYMAN